MRTAYALLVLVPLVGCVHIETEQFYQWYELRPPPSDEAVSRFREQFPSTNVTTTQPGTWNKIEVGMTRGMIRALVEGRLVDKSRDLSLLTQEQEPFFDESHVRLYFARGTSPAAEHDVLRAIIVRRVINRPIQSTDWP